jgi:hypothetical protein
MDTVTLPNLMTAMDVGLWLTLSARQVERMARRGEIPSVTLPNGDLLFDAAELARWVEALRAERKGARNAS